MSENKVENKVETTVNPFDALTKNITKENKHRDTLFFLSGVENGGTKAAEIKRKIDLTKAAESFDALFSAIKSTNKLTDEQKITLQLAFAVYLARK